MTVIVKHSPGEFGLQKRHDLKYFHEVEVVDISCQEKRTFVDGLK